MKDFEVNPNLNREQVKAAFFGEPEPNLNLQNLDLVNLNRKKFGFDEPEPNL